MSTDKDTIIELRRRIDYLIKEIDDLRFTCREQANELTRLKVCALDTEAEKIALDEWLEVKND